VVPDSKAARSKIARNRNVSANNASVKNKAVVANRAAAISKADDKADGIGYIERRGATPAVCFTDC
jgi:hypothetical protein